MIVQFFVCFFLNLCVCVFKFCADLQRLGEESSSMEISTLSLSTPIVPLSALSTSHYVQLWPVFQHLGVLAELSYLLTSSQNWMQNIEERQQLMNYTCRATPSTSCFAVFGEQVQ